MSRKQGAIKSVKGRGRHSRLAVEPLESRWLLSAAPMKLEIGTNDSSNANNLVDVGGIVYFQADDGIHGSELWKSDGTEAGTVLVKDINSGGDAFSTWFPASLTNVNGTLFFVADDGVSGMELWKSDGTEAGTVLVKDISTGWPYPSSLTNVNGILFFTAYDDTLGVELWKSDGTEAGTVIVADINPGNSSYPQQLTNINGSLYFTADDGTHGRELWKSDGTQAGTVMVSDLNVDGNSDPAYLTVLSDTIFFRANDGIHGQELWKSDGTEAGTVLVEDIRPGSESSYPESLTAANGALFFTATDGTHGTELWKSDGTEVGTVLVTDLQAGGDGSYPSALMSLNGTVFFSTFTGVWRTDGTEVGTTAVDYLGTTTPTNIDGTLYFTVSSPQGTELWKSDGTEAGTVLVKAGVGTSSLENLTNVAGKLFFTAIDGTHGRELWFCDGTDAGTHFVKDINQVNSRSSNPSGYVASGGWTYFVADDGVHGRELWKTDGTQPGTVMVKDIQPGASTNIFEGPNSLVDVGGVLFFTANDGFHGRELWKTDGSEAGTVMVKNINGDANDSSVLELTNVNGTLFFTANDGIHGRELWKSDGTDAGTVMIEDLHPPASLSYPGGLKSVHGTLYFYVNRSFFSGGNLWKSDGTEAGTISASFMESTPIDVEGTLYFYKFNDAAGLWKGDGTVAGSTLVKSAPTTAGIGEAVSLNGNLYFGWYDDVHGGELWKSDGTEAGTAMVKDIFPGGGGETFANSNPSDLTPVGNTLFFLANDGTHGSKLWASDGTEAGTRMVKDICPGAPLAGISSLINVNGRLYFIADDGIHGSELWTSDGTESGTVMIQDIRPGSEGSMGYGIQMTNSNGTLLFGANDGVTGGDPWLLRVPSTVAGQHLFYEGSTRWDVTNGETYSDDNAIAVDKSAYLPGSGAATFANVSSYSKGITGIMVDLAGSHGEITANDFLFKVGNDNSPENWANAPAPLTVLVRSGAGTSGADRVEIIWAENAIKKQWLQVTVKGNDSRGDFNSNTGLANSYSFFFGSAPGDTGLGNTTRFSVNVTDELHARNNPKSLFHNTPITNVDDFNRDGRVDVSDQLIARNNPTSNFTGLVTLDLGAGVSANFGALAASSSMTAISIVDYDAAFGYVDAIRAGLSAPTGPQYAAFPTLPVPLAISSIPSAAMKAAVAPLATDELSAESHRGLDIVMASDNFEDDDLLDVLVAGQLEPLLRWTDHA